MPASRRALKLSAAAKDGETATLRTIGHAALAADNRVNGDAVVAPCGAPDGRQSDGLAGGEDVDVSDRLLHRRTADRRPKGRAQERNSACPWSRGKFIAARNDRSHSHRPALRHGWGHLFEPRSCGCDRRFEARPRHHDHRRIDAAVPHRRSTSASRTTSNRSKRRVRKCFGSPPILRPTSASSTRNRSRPPFTPAMIAPRPKLIEFKQFWA